MVRRRCLYDVLEVERKATGAEIKVAYRRLALVHHPDKNAPEDKEDAEERFRELREAFDVLKDPHERAWYDAHRTEFLQGGAGSDDEEGGRVPDLGPYFSASIFTGYETGDDASFYSVYARIFGQIDREEDDCDGDASASERDPLPRFGDDRIDDDSLREFYDHWLSFGTRRTFFWLDRWNTREAENRQIRRLMERDNSRAREKGRREFGARVRQLVKHVRDLDPRWKDLRARARERARQKEEQEKEEALRRKRERMERAMNFDLPEWADTDGQVEEMIRQHLEEEEKEKAAKRGGGRGGRGTGAVGAGGEGGEGGADGADGEGGDDGGDDAGHGAEPDWDALYCHACNKKFKSEKQRTNHDQSKKHREQVARLRAELSIAGVDTAFLADETHPTTSSPGGGGKKSKKKKKKNKDTANGNGNGNNNDGDDAVATDAVATEKGKGVADGGDDDNDDNDDDVDDDDDDGPRDKVGAKTPEIARSGSPSPSAGGSDAGSVAESEEIVTSVPQPKRGAAARKREKRAAKERARQEALIAAASGRRTENDTAVQEGDSDDPSLTEQCQICSARFPSKTKLFKHVRELGHAVLKDVLEPAGGKKKGKNRAKRK